MQTQTTEGTAVPNKSKKPELAQAPARLIDVAEVDISGGTQTREKFDLATLDEYSAVWDAWKASGLLGTCPFPRVTVYMEEDKTTGTKTYWLADGFHRVLSARKSEIQFVAANVYKGTRRDAMLAALGANSDHGLKRSNADKRKSVLIMLSDPEWMNWSDIAIANTCKVSDRLVNKLREDNDNVTPNIRSENKTYVNKHGQTAVMNTANIGKKAAAEPDPDEPSLDAVKYNDNGKVYSVRAGAGNTFWFIAAGDARARGDNLDRTFTTRREAQEQLDQWAEDNCIPEYCEYETPSVAAELPRLNQTFHVGPRDIEFIDAVIALCAEYGDVIADPAYARFFATVGELDGLRA